MFCMIAVQNTRVPTKSCQSTANWSASITRKASNANLLVTTALSSLSFQPRSIIAAMTTGFGHPRIAGQFATAHVRSLVVVDVAKACRGGCTDAPPGLEYREN